MKKILLGLAVLLLPSLVLATTVMFKDGENNFTIGEKRAVGFVDGKKYICEFVLNTPEEIDDDGLVFDADSYDCNNRIFFALKHYTHTDVYQIRLYNARSGKYLYDKRVLNTEFNVISKT